MLGTDADFFLCHQADCLYAKYTTTIKINTKHKWQSYSEIDSPSTMPKDLHLDRKPHTQNIVAQRAANDSHDRRTANENRDQTQPITVLYDLSHAFVFLCENTGGSQIEGRVFHSLIVLG